MSISPKLIYKFNAYLFYIPIEFFCGSWKFHPEIHTEG